MEFRPIELLSMYFIDPNIPCEQVTDQYVATQIIGQYDSLSEEEKENTYVMLACCSGITDVSMLNNVKILDLSRCTGITDVSALGNVHKLDLSDCTGITDVSMLNNVKILYLYGCTGIPKEQIEELRKQGVKIYY